VKRRNLVATLATGVGVGVAGCVAGGGGSSDGTDSGDGTTDTGNGNSTRTGGSTDTSDGSGGSSGSGGSGDSTPTVTDTQFSARQECSGSTGARIEFTEDAVVATGCIRGPNGCHVAALQDATLQDGTLRIVVTTEKEGGTDIGCTQAVVQRGYEVTVSTAGGHPSTVEVVHASMDERTTVATGEP
jgi:hypothetical protein